MSFPRRANWAMLNVPAATFRRPAHGRLFRAAMIAVISFNLPGDALRDSLPPPAPNSKSPPSPAKSTQHICTGRLGRQMSGNAQSGENGYSPVPMELGSS